MLEQAPTHTTDEWKVSHQVKDGAPLNWLPLHLCFASVAEDPEEREYAFDALDELKYFAPSGLMASFTQYNIPKIFQTMFKGSFPLYLQVSKEISLLLLGFEENLASLKKWHLYMARSPIIKRLREADGSCVNREDGIRVARLELLWLELLWLLTSLPPSATIVSINNLGFHRDAVAAYHHAAGESRVAADEAPERAAEQLQLKANQALIQNSIAGNSVNQDVAELLVTRLQIATQLYRHLPQGIGAEYGFVKLVERMLACFHSAEEANAFIEQFSQFLDELLLIVEREAKAAAVDSQGRPLIGDPRTTGLKEFLERLESAEFAKGLQPCEATTMIFTCDCNQQPCGCELAVVALRVNIIAGSPFKDFGESIQGLLSWPTRQELLSSADVYIQQVDNENQRQRQEWLQKELIERHWPIQMVPLINQLVFITIGRS